MVCPYCLSTKVIDNGKCRICLDCGRVVEKQTLVKRINHDRKKDLVRFRIIRIEDIPQFKTN